MVKEILVPLDGSKLAERALAIARDLAGALGARLTLLRVIAPNAAGEGGEAQADAETYLRDVAKRLGGSEVTADVRSGDAAPVILAEVEQRGIDLIAMSTHGRSGIGRWIYGSVADEVVRHAPVPVVLVPATSALREWPTDRPPRLLVSLDFSP
ncbi:MAG TPA: universal stress protein, partial [Chloroflexota bacterium]|nr:universal stress protein [Chloroflexota bacterium]